jgi:hypothetical protein
MENREELTVGKREKGPDGVVRVSLGLPKRECHWVSLGSVGPVAVAVPSVYSEYDSE